MSLSYIIDTKERFAFWLAVLGSSYVVCKTLISYFALPSTADTLRGPKSQSWLIGNSEDYRLPYPNERFQRWVQEYGTTFPVYGFFGVRELVVGDTNAMSIILNQTADFPKPASLINTTKHLVGDGVLAAQGYEHKRQRKVLNPAFSMTVMRDISPMLMRVAHELKDSWKKELSCSPPNSGVREIDVLRGFCKAALDMIGLAGFGSEFNSLHDSTNELASAFKELSISISLLKGLGLLTAFFPILQYLPIGSNVANQRNRYIMDRVGLQMITDKKVEVQTLGIDAEALGKDLLSVMLRSNLQENSADRLDDETLRAQIATFLLAGHETTANALTWGLHALAKLPSVQSKLRDEVLAFPDDSPSMDDLNAMPYLNNVVKEILRMMPPVSTLRRIAREDSVLPLARPIVDKNGKTINEIFLRRGESLMVHIFASNTSPDLWGPDAFEFRPERFDKLPEAVSGIPSLFGNLLTFSAGPKGCIGWRMAVIEMQALLFTLIRTFEFSIDPGLEITSRFSFAIKPQIKGQEGNGPQLPLRVSLHPNTSL
ncbi:hypothetical protein FRB93_003874 [Tulasnella sp. JGI-2019a]|nr:hypothetical protein FRB93_003874 [Tulasnella sp. JGI-2019a]